MEVHVFSNKDNLYGFSIDRTGNNLPHQDSKWKYFKTITPEAGEPPRIALETDDLLKALDEKGYFVSRVIVKVTAK